MHKIVQMVLTQLTHSVGPTTLNWYFIMFDWQRRQWRESFIHCFTNSLHLPNLTQHRKCRPSRDMWQDRSIILAFSWESIGCGAG